MLCLRPCACAPEVGIGLDWMDIQLGRPVDHSLYLHTVLFLTRYFYSVYRLWGGRVARWALTLASAPMVVGSIPALSERDFWVPAPTPAIPIIVGS